MRDIGAGGKRRYKCGDAAKERSLQDGLHPVYAAYRAGGLEQSKADVQINLMDTAINQGADAIFLQPVDSVGIGPAIKKARAAGIPVITLNIDSTESTVSSGGK